MNKLKVSTRLALTTGLLALLLAIVGLMGLAGIRAGNQSLKTVFDDRVVPLAQLAEIQREQDAAQRDIDEALMAGTPQALDKAVTEIERHGQRIDVVWKDYMATYLTPEEARLAQEVAQARQRQRGEGLAPVIAAMRAHDTARADRAVRTVLDPATVAVASRLEKLIALQIEVAGQEYAAAVVRYERAQVTTIGAIVIGLLAAGLLAWGLTRSLTRQLGAEPAEASALAHAVAQGDLAVPIRLRAGDATSLMAALQQMQHSLQRTVGAVRRDADSVSTASAEIARGTQDLSQRTEEQASALQQTAASMEQLTSTVRQNAEHAHSARQLADGAAEVAQRGGGAVQDVVRTMKGIQDSSRRIGEIIGTIDGIAFQTNILALNAAVEAARAGEQGRGFAVVAGEVRSLAQRCAEAAKEVKQLIGESVDRVDAGTQQVGEAGARMHEIEGAIGRVKDLIAEISSASREQSDGVSQIGEAVAQMDQVTQQNAALVEESSAAAESLRLQSTHMLQAVSVFKLPAAAASSPTAAPGAPALAGPTVTPRRVATGGSSQAPRKGTIQASAREEEWMAF